MNFKSVLPALIAALTPFVVAIAGPLKAVIASHPLWSAVVGSLGAFVLALQQPPTAAAPKALPAPAPACPACEARQKDQAQP